MRTILASAAVVASLALACGSNAGDSTRGAEYLNALQNNAPAPWLGSSCTTAADCGGTAGQDVRCEPYTNQAGSARYCVGFGAVCSSVGADVVDGRCTLPCTRTETLSITCDGQAAGSLPCADRFANFDGCGPKAFCELRVRAQSDGGVGHWETTPGRSRCLPDYR